MSVFAHVCAYNTPVFPVTNEQIYYMQASSSHGYLKAVNHSTLRIHVKSHGAAQPIGTLPLDPNGLALTV